MRNHVLYTHTEKKEKQPYTKLINQKKNQPIQLCSREILHRCIKHRSFSSPFPLELKGGGRGRKTCSTACVTFVSVPDGCGAPEWVSDSEKTPPFAQNNTRPPHELGRHQSPPTKKIRNLALVHSWAINEDPEKKTTAPRRSNAQQQFAPLVHGKTDRDHRDHLEVADPQPDPVSPPPFFDPDPARRFADPHAMAVPHRAADLHAPPDDLERVRGRLRDESRDAAGEELGPVGQDGAVGMFGRRRKGG